MQFPWHGMSEDGNTVILHRHPKNYFQHEANVQNKAEVFSGDDFRLAVALDVETTGLDTRRDKVIQIGIRQFTFNRFTGEIVQVSTKNAYEGLQDPGFPLDPKITALTGITDEQVKGQSIRWDTVKELIDSSHLVIAHNASFDRPHIENNLACSAQKIWGCSLSQINWRDMGFPTSKLEILNIFHGFYTNSHNALADVDALIRILRMQSPREDRSPYFQELLQAVRKPLAKIKATYSPYETKDALRERGYRWESATKVWERKIQRDLLEEEVSWLEEFVYMGNFRGHVEEIKLTDTFRASFHLQAK